MILRQKESPLRSVDIESGQRLQSSSIPVARNTTLLLVMVWYGAAVVSITSSKMILTQSPYPYTLCLCQVVRYRSSLCCHSTLHAIFSFILSILPSSLLAFLLFFLPLSLLASLLFSFPFLLSHPNSIPAQNQFCK